MKNITKREYSIAVLLPTRGRTTALSHSVISLCNRAKDVSRLQILLGFDDDDTASLDYFTENIQPWLDRKKVSYTVLGFPPMGYIRLNEYVNTLARSADADWLVFWNDDALMETPAWDSIIAAHTGEFKLLAFHTHKDHPYSIFPIVPIEWLEVLGYLSPHQISDAWLSQQSYLLDIWERVEIYVNHDRHDLTGNNKDETFENRPMLEGNPASPKDFHHLTWQNKRIADCGKLSAYMESRGLDTTWFKNCMAGAQDPWEKLKANDVNNQMRSWNISYKKI